MYFVVAQLFVSGWCAALAIVDVGYGHLELGALNWVLSAVNFGLGVAGIRRHHHTGSA